MRTSLHNWLPGARALAVSLVVGWLATAVAAAEQAPGGSQPPKGSAAANPSKSVAATKAAVSPTTKTASAPAQKPTTAGTVKVTPSAVGASQSQSSKPVTSAKAASAGSKVSAHPSAGKSDAKNGAAVPAARSGSVATDVRGNSAAASHGTRTSAGVHPVAQLDEHLTYQYNALGRRDPFQSLVDGEYVGADVGGDAPPDAGGLKVVGIVWGDSDKFALVEDGRGNSFVLRQGDKVMNGYVATLKRDAMVVNLTVDGQSETVTIPLTRKGDKSNASR